MDDILLEDKYKYSSDVTPSNVDGSMDDIWLENKDINWSDVKPVNVVGSIDLIFLELRLMLVSCIG
jgi:hypothetical protein